MEDRLQSLTRWLQVNGVQLRCCTIKDSENCSSGLGLFTSCNTTEGVVMVVPLHLAITPMRVLQDSHLGNAYGRLFEEGEVDDRLLMILFLLVERIRGPSSFWAPYLEVLPESFGTPLWFSEQELQELKGTALYSASTLQLKNLKVLFDEKVKPFVESLLFSIGIERNVEFQEFLWANCIFWTRALTIPCSHDFVFPQQLPTAPAKGEEVSQLEQLPPVCAAHPPEGSGELALSHVAGPEGTEQKTIWIEGLVPGIDFCNHDKKPVACWEVDGAGGHITGVPDSMYLTAGIPLPKSKEVLISYGNKGNEELLFLYGFVMMENPDDYLMVHYPKKALEQDHCGIAKSQLLQEQVLSLRWLLPSSLLEIGFYQEERAKSCHGQEDFRQAAPSSYSWSGNRKQPSFIQKFVFPEDTIAALRVVAMKEDELERVLSMLDELSQSRLQKPPSCEDMRSAIWEVCGNSGALQLLTNLLTARVLDLEEGTGTEDSDTAMLEKDFQTHLQDTNNSSKDLLSNNLRSCVIYRRGQKYLAKQFLKESERLLELTALEEQNSMGVATSM